MDHVINVSAVKKKMSKEPAGQRLYHFFIGVPNQLTKEELNDLKKILNREHKKIIATIERYTPAQAS